MGEIRINLTNFVTIGAIAFIAIYAANKLLVASGHPDWQA